MGDAEEIASALGLQPHPEGGRYVETYRHETGDGRGAVTHIYYLLVAGERSHWHRVTDAIEIWHHYAGGRLLLSLSHDGHGIDRHRLGPGLAAGDRPAVVVPAGCWQAAEPLGGWTLVGCTVSPAFAFSGFEMAPPGWEPGGGPPQ